MPLAEGPLDLGLRGERIGRLAAFPLPDDEDFGRTGVSGSGVSPSCATRRP
ncbi:hypothetical protein [Streptomyces sp. KHY 26]|uniref:hypothetical protein n=1 Tax=Streptomyces sp. KHY 26 TaxID=3097359 RepID=UPI00376F1812